ncbi:MAG: SHOCT domain-containing protein [Planctomycetes bacterium]|nr:SHOCT domain-containing protein [Planctomycetota bacterium]
MRRLVFAAAALAAVASGCLGPHWVESDPLFDDGVNIVCLETRTHKGAEVDQGYAHPATVQAEWLEPFLASVAYDEPRLIGSIEGKPIFERDAARILAQEMQEAFAAAKPSQRVRFSAIRREANLVIFRSRRVTSGVAFVEPAGTINVAFERVDDPEDREDVGAGYRGDPALSELAYARIVPPPGGRLHMDEARDRQHRLWVEGDLSTPPIVLAPIEEPKEPPPAEASAAPAAASVKPEPEVAPAKSSERLPAKEPTRDTFDEKLWEARVKLRQLKDLREKGLLSEEDYLKAREELLESLE